jgi:DNA-binding transcriptional ArsR family regulator
MESYKVGGAGKPSEDQIKRIKMVISEIPDDDTLFKNADIIKALADPTRLKIIHLLSYGELCVCEIFSALEKPQPTISHHLNILKKAGFLEWRKEGVWNHYSLSNPKIIDDLNELMENR